MAKSFPNPYDEDDDRTWSDVLQVCERGHKITAYGKSQPETLKELCPECGSKTLTKCPNCSRGFDGYRHIPGVLHLSEPDAPLHCSGCGRDFPWTSAKTSAKGPDTRNSVEVICAMLRRFPLVARQLRDRHSERTTLDISDEYDVQDLLHALLHLHFDDIRPEEYTPSYAGGSSRMDFLLKAEQIVVEAKKTRAGLGAKEVGEQLLIDIGKYRASPDCKTLVCFIHDPENRIRNPAGLVSDLESKWKSSPLVRVVIA